MKIEDFGINRSNLFTRQGDFPSVKLPRIIGIECVGEIEAPSDSSYQKGQQGISVMGGLGREFDGNYAEYVLIPSTQDYPINNDIDWVEMATIPEMYYTAYASIFDVLRLSSTPVFALIFVVLLENIASADLINVYIRQVVS
ncbi:MAG: alcohol dehydrogenase [Firmicutes bacterium]|nr:alcohol dehydrogenase [Bacillota bacterium]